MTAQTFHPCGELCIVSERHATFGSGNNLDRVKAEHGDIRMCAIAYWSAKVIGTDCMAGILDDVDSVGIGEFRYAGHIGGLSTHVNYNNYLWQSTHTGQPPRVLPPERPHRC